VLGAVFAAHYFGRRRWLLQFPVVQVSGLGEVRVSHTSNCFDSSQTEGDMQVFTRLFATIEVEFSGLTLAITLVCNWIPYLGCSGGFCY
jgi:hypothetical protein